MAEFYFLEHEHGTPEIFGDQEDFFSCKALPFGVVSEDCEVLPAENEASDYIFDEMDEFLIWNARGNMIFENLPDTIKNTSEFEDESEIIDVEAVEKELIQNSLENEFATVSILPEFQSE